MFGMKKMLCDFSDSSFLSISFYLFNSFRVKRLPFNLSGGAPMIFVPFGLTVQPGAVVFVPLSRCLSFYMHRTLHERG
jgi:hypothetical protein